MMKLDRSVAPIPSALDGLRSKGNKELIKARIHFGAGSSSSNFDFQAYRDDSVRSALANISRNVCCYCEVHIGSSPGDIEHFRPKSEVLNESGAVVTGYWWLAARWENLLFSCVDCNRRRYHDDNEVNSRRLAGKGTLFPLEDESQRATAEGGESSERPLLLNPFSDDPATHIRLTTKNGESVVEARLVEGNPSKQAMKTIEVIGLNRPNLVKDRTATLTAISGLIKNCERWALLVESAIKCGASEDLIKIVEDNFKVAKQELADAVKRNCSFRSLLVSLFESSALLGQLGVKYEPASGMITVN